MRAKAGSRRKKELLETETKSQLRPMEEGKQSPAKEPEGFTEKESSGFALEPEGTRPTAAHR